MGKGPGFSSIWRRAISIEAVEMDKSSFKNLINLVKWVEAIIGLHLRFYAFIMDRFIGWSNYFKLHNQHFCGTFLNFREKHGKLNHFLTAAVEELINPKCWLVSDPQVTSIKLTVRAVNLQFAVSVDLWSKNNQ
jgi:hypothetical protein